MTRQEFLNLLEDIFEIDHGSLKGDEVLADMSEWGSIAFLSMIAMIDEKFDLILDGSQLENINTVADIINLVESKLE